MLFLFILVIFGNTIRAQKLPPWGITNCDRNNKDCYANSTQTSSCEPIFRDGKYFININVLLPADRFYIVNLEEAKTILTNATEEIYAQKILDDKVNLTFIYKDDNCEQAHGTIAALNTHIQNCSHVIIGLPCDLSLAGIGRISKYLGDDGLPIITSGGFTWDFSKEKTKCDSEFFMVTNTGPVDYRSFGEFFHLVMKQYNWTKIALMYEKGDQNEIGGEIGCQYLLESVIEDLLEIDNFYFTSSDLKLLDLPYDEVLRKNVGVKHGIVLICASEKHTREILIEAEKLKMMEKGEYIFFNFALYSNSTEQKHPAKPWYDPLDNDENNNRAEIAFRSLYTFLPEIEAVKIEQNMITPRGELYLDGIYDALILFAHVLSEIIQNSTSEFRLLGSDMVYRMLGRTFKACCYSFQKLSSNSKVTNSLLEQLRNPTALSRLCCSEFGLRRWNRDVVMNCNGQRNSKYALMQMNSTKHLHIVLEYNMQNKTIEYVRDIRWPNGNIPLDTPICGYDNSLCPSGVNVLVIVISTIGAVFFIAVVVFLYRRYKLEAEIASMSWKVHWNDIIFVGRSTESLMHTKRGSQTTLVRSEADGFSLMGDRQLFTTVAYYQSTKTAIKKLRDIKLVLNRAQLLELKLMKDLANDHLVKFYGACLENPHCCILTEYCQKGSLQDILEDDEIKLDWLFKLSLIQDLVRGMQYLHSTSIKFHGLLKSSNCVVDSRFVLKIADFGLHFLRIHAQEDALDESSHSYWQRQLWTCPELLRSDNTQLYGTQKGDVYSFAIVVHEIIMRQGVFNLGDDMYMTPRVALKLSTRAATDFEKAYCLILELLRKWINLPTPIMHHYNTYTTFFEYLYELHKNKAFKYIIKLKLK